MSDQEIDRQAKLIAHAAMGRFISAVSVHQPELVRTIPLDDQGRRVMVPALGTDSVHDVVRLICQAGGRGTVVVAIPTVGEDGAPNGFQIQTARVEASTRDSNDVDCDVPVGPSCTIADVLAVLAPGGSLTFRADHSELTLQEPSTTAVGEIDGMVSA